MFRIFAQAKYTAEVSIFTLSLPNGNALYQS
jgi:hypothetical protein